PKEDSKTFVPGRDPGGAVTPAASAQASAAAARPATPPPPPVAPAPVAGPGGPAGHGSVYTPASQPAVPRERLGRVRETRRNQADLHALLRQGRSRRLARVSPPERFARWHQCRAA